MTDLLEHETLVVITTDCECEDEDGNLLANGCYGEFWEDNLAFLEEYVIKPFIESKDSSLSDSVIFEGEAIGWQRRSGYYVLNEELTAKSFIKVMGLDGAQYILRVRWNEQDKTLKVTRSSHDEPTGAPHTVSFLPKCKACGQGNKDLNSAWCSEDCLIDLMADSQIALSD